MRVAIKIVIVEFIRLQVWGMVQSHLVGKALYEILCDTRRGKPHFKNTTGTIRQGKKICLFLRTSSDTSSDTILPIEVRNWFFILIQFIMRRKRKD